MGKKEVLAVTRSGRVVKSTVETKMGSIDYFQFILKHLHNKESDVFAFFDIDCCKIGWFPGLDSVVTCPAFIRSMFSRVNYLDVYKGKAGRKHIYRLIKYYERMSVYTSCVPEPMLSFYHTFNDVVNEVKMDKLVFWGHTIWGFSWNQISLTGWKIENPDDKEIEESKKTMGQWKINLLTDLDFFEKDGKYRNLPKMKYRVDFDDKERLNVSHYHPELVRNFFDPEKKPKWNGYGGTDMGYYFETSEENERTYKTLEYFLNCIKDKSIVIDEEIYSLTLEKDELSLPYMCKSVGIVFDINKKPFVYEKRKFSNSSQRKKEMEKSYKEIQRLKEYKVFPWSK